MPTENAPLRKLGFLTLGVFDREDPAPAHESLLQVIELGERLGFDSAWLRHRHLQYGVSSPVARLRSVTFCPARSMAMASVWLRTSTA